MFCHCQDKFYSRADTKFTEDREGKNFLLLVIICKFQKPKYWLLTISCGEQHSRISVILVSFSEFTCHPKSQAEYPTFTRRQLDEGKIFK